MKNYKKKIIIYVIAFIVCGIVAYLLYTFLNNDTKTDNKKESAIEEQYSFPASSDEQELFEDKLLGVEISDTLYILELEDTDTAKDLLYMSPFNITMEKDDNSFRGYLKTSLSSGNNYVSNVTVGDVMLYNNNCLVIFTEDLEIDDNYILIGHIVNLDTIDGDSLEVSFVR